MKDQLFQPVLTFLKQQGATEDEIANTIADITQGATMLLYKEALETFSDEDMQQIENAPDDELANKLIAERYAQKVGVPPEELLTVFLKDFVKNFLEEKN